MSGYLHEIGAYPDQATAIASKLGVDETAIRSTLAVLEQMHGVVRQQEAPISTAPEILQNVAHPAVEQTQQDDAVAAARAQVNESLKNAA